MQPRGKVGGFWGRGVGKVRDEAAVGLFNELGPTSVYNMQNPGRVWLAGWLVAVAGGQVTSQATASKQAGRQAARQHHHHQQHHQGGTRREGSLRSSCQRHSRLLGSWQLTLRHSQHASPRAIHCMGSDDRVKSKSPPQSCQRQQPGKCMMSPSIQCRSTATARLLDFGFLRPVSAIASRFNEQSPVSQSARQVSCQMRHTRL